MKNTVSNTGRLLCHILKQEEKKKNLKKPLKKWGLIMRPCRICNQEPLNGFMPSRIKKTDWICHSCHKIEVDKKRKQKKEELKNEGVLRKDKQ